MTSRELVPAMGGVRQVPAPDAIASEYLLLALRLDQRVPGMVDGYFGPAAIKAQVDLEQGRSPARLREDARLLRDRVATEMPEADRRAWLDAQLVALEAHAAGLAGDSLPYEEHVARCMGFAPPRHPDAEFDAARAVIDELLPGKAPLVDRLGAWDRELEVAVDRLPAVVDWLVERFRACAKRDFGLPDGEDLRVALVTVANLCLCLRRGRGAPAPLGRGRAARGARGPIWAPPPRAVHARSTPRGPRLRARPITGPA